MVTEVDHTVVQDKLVTVLQGNAALYVTPPTNKRKFRFLGRGSPDLNKIQELPMPSLYVTSDEREIDRYEQEGADHNGVILGAKITFIYNIVMVVQENTSARAEELLNAASNVVKATLGANARLGDVGNVTANMVVHGSRILRTETLDPVLIGHQQQSRVVVLELWKHIT